MNKNFAVLFNKPTYYWTGLLWGLSLFVLLPYQGYSQAYSKSGGIRLAYGGLLTYKQSLNEQNYLEGILAIRWGGFELTGLFEYQKQLKDTELDWYLGAGMYCGIHGRQNEFQPADDANEVVQINLGMDLLGGIEYVFPSIPVALSADYKPSFSFTGTRWFIPEGFGLSARYIIQ